MRPPNSQVPRLQKDQPQMKTVYATALAVKPCCSRCRRPAERCTDPACAKASLYHGILLRSEWVPAPQVTRPMTVGAASPAALRA